MKNTEKPIDASAKREQIERAIRSPYNLLGLSASVAATAVMLTPWPLIVGAALEAVYLGAAATGVFNRAGSGNVAAVPALATENRERPAPAETQPSQPRDPEMSPELMTGEVQGRYLRLEATFRLIRLQLEDGKPTHRDLVDQLQFLLDRYVYFAGKQELFYERLQSVANQAKALKAKNPPAAGVVDLQLIYTSPGALEDMPLEQWVEAKMKQAHDGYEQELREIAGRREQRGGDVPDAALERTAQHLLRCNRYVDRIGKSLLNLHYELQLLDKKFAMISEEMSTRRIEQVLADVKALVLQTQSLTRTVEEIEPMDGISEYAAA
jgi:hypothetical protein